MPRAHPTAPFTLDSLEGRVLTAADPITPDHPLWAIPRGEAAIDGVLNDADWHNAWQIVRTQGTRANGAVTIRLMYNESGLFLSAHAQDETLWADGRGGGAGERWEIETDDSVTFYFDPDGSRDEYFGPGDRAIGVNLAHPDSPLGGSGGGAVRRAKLVRGDGAGGAPDANPGGALGDGIVYRSSVIGTLNDPSDTDTGWSTEIFIAWSALNMSGAPAHGQTIGMNFDAIFDSDGGERHFADLRHGPQRFTAPAFIDDHVQGVHSSFHASLAGIRGPVSYAEAMFVDGRAGEEAPAPAGLTWDEVSAYGARLSFDAPAATSAGLGHVSAYDIRYSTAPITSEADWAGAAVYENAFVPRLRGLKERLRLAALAPETTHYVAVRAIDAAGNPGQIAFAPAFTTGAALAGTDGQRIIVSPNGRTLMHEDGRPFVPVGDHLGLSWGYTRNLFPGDVWDPDAQVYHNFNEEPSYEGLARPYFYNLQAHGVNTMRVFLELHGLDQTGNPETPRGRHWLEYPRGTFNPDMREFIHNLLYESSRAGIFLILSPFDTFSYDEAFASETPWAAGNGGPLTDIDDFFQNPGTLAMAKERMATVIGWVNESPYAAHVLGWEPLNEWNSYEWTLNAEGDGEAGRETEMRRRAAWVGELAQHIRDLDPAHLVLNSPVVTDPRGPVARSVFYDRRFDVLAPHFYTNSSEEPINSPHADTSILPAVESGIVTSYWLTHGEGARPLLNGEWGLTRADWPGGVPGYTPDFTRAEDAAIFRTVLWSGFASGQIGTGLRNPADELAWNRYILSPEMRDLQQTFGRFVAGASLQIDFTNFRHRSLAGSMGVSSAAGHSLLGWGVSDGAQGVLYVLRDANRTGGAVGDARLLVHGIGADRFVDVEVWSTGAQAAGPLATITGVYTGAGTLDVMLPEFGTDVAIKFKAREPSGSAPYQTVASIDLGSAIVAFSLGESGDGRPIATILDTVTGAVSKQDISAVAGFSAARGGAVDLAAYRTPDGLVHLAFTDESRHLWVVTGKITTGDWDAIDLTATYGFAGIGGDLTTFQPSWGTVHIAGVDARGHAVNYWWAPDLGWVYNDLTADYGGPTFEGGGGLTGYVASWDGLNLAGLNSAGETVVYWWSPDLGPGGWRSQNMTVDFGGPLFAGRIDAFVTPWGGLNIAGTTGAGEVYTYWWAPTFDAEPHRWRVTNITEEAGGPGRLAGGLGGAPDAGVEAVMSADGAINLYGVDASAQLWQYRWTPGGVGGAAGWTPRVLTDGARGERVRFPLGASATGHTIAVFAPAADDARVLMRFVVDVRYEVAA